MARRVVAALAFTAAALLPRPVLAQTSTGGLRGYVRDSSGTPLSGAEVRARNVATGAERAATTRDDGFYVMLGLVPADYDVTVRRIGSSPVTQRLHVQVAATLDYNVRLTSRPVEVAGLTVSAPPPADTRTSEVATNVSQQQIQSLPSPSRNFLDLAALAPGVIVSPDLTFLGSPNRIPARTFTVGAGGPGEVNVFIDGASLKNDLTGSGASGVAGQDASRGNPFPRSAIQEYRVITQNFKAEYQNASSGIIAATTRSGGNSWSGNAFVTYQDAGLVAVDSFTKADPNFKGHPNYSRYLVGLSAGGPIIRDRLHFFGSYEGNYQNRSLPVSFGTVPASGAFPALDTVNLGRFAGSFTQPFRETLLFGKLSYDIDEHSSAELSFSNRHETDVRDFGGTTSLQSATNFQQDAPIGVFKYSRASGSWLEQAQATYESFRRFPTAATGNLPNRQYFGFGTFSGADIGSYNSFQDFTQKTLGLRNDVTWTGWRWAGNHAVKLGVNVNFLTFDIQKRNNSIPTFFYADSVCRGCGGAVPQQWFGYRSPYSAVWADGPNPFVNTHNTQFGAYLQDDWNPTSRLTINAGLRWDYESHMFNRDYVTPQWVIDTITAYNNTLQHPIDPATYFTNGTKRKPFLGAWQPRLGFSYALDDQNRTTLFGGAGLFYDRTFFDVSVDETLKLTYPTYSVDFADPDSTPRPGQVAWNDRYLTTNRAVLDSLVTAGPGGREVWLIANNAKVPYSMQWNVGVRHTFGSLTASLAYVGSRGYDQFVMNWANLAMDSTGKCCKGGGFGHGISNVIYSTNNVRSWYDAVQVTVNRPYQRTGNWGWGAGLSWTAGSRYISGVDNPGDEFAFPQATFIRKHPSNDEKSRFVGNWVVDIPYLWGIQFSGLLTLGTGPRYDIGSRFNGFAGPYLPGGFSPPQYAFVVPGAWAFRELDLRLRKDFPHISSGSLGVTADVFNVFNDKNYTWDGNSGKPNGLAGDQRRAQLGLEYTF